MQCGAEGPITSRQTVPLPSFPQAASRRDGHFAVTRLGWGTYIHTAQPLPQEAGVRAALASLRFVACRCSPRTRPRPDPRRQMGRTIVVCPRTWPELPGGARSRGTEQMALRSHPSVPSNTWQIALRRRSRFAGHRWSRRQRVQNVAAPAARLVRSLCPRSCSNASVLLRPLNTTGMSPERAMRRLGIGSGRHCPDCLDRAPVSSCSLTGREPGRCLTNRPSCRSVDSARLVTVCTTDLPTRTGAIARAFIDPVIVAAPDSFHSCLVPRPFLPASTWCNHDGPGHDIADAAVAGPMMCMLPSSPCVGGCR